MVAAEGISDDRTKILENVHLYTELFLGNERQIKWQKGIKKIKGFF